MTRDPRSDGARRIPALIVESDGRVRRGIRSVIQSFPDLELVMESTSARAIVEFLAHASPIAIVNVEPSELAEGMELVSRLSQKGCSVVVMSTRSGLGSAALAAGAVAFVEKDERGAASLVEALRQATEMGPSHEQSQSP